VQEDGRGAGGDRPHPGGISQPGVKIRTDFTEMLGIDYPIVGAPMFLVSYEEYTIAVSETGALGAFPLPNYPTTAALKEALRNIRRGSRSVIESIWIGFPLEVDPLALGIRLLTIPRQVSDREGVLLVSQIPDLVHGEWFPLETRIHGQGGEIL